MQFPLPFPITAALVMLCRCSGRFAPGTIAADSIRSPFGAKRLTTSGFSWHRVQASELALSLAADPRRLAVEIHMPANRFELLTTWYLRFNGYFTTTDFTIHPDYRKRPGGTDADVLAVRFPFSVEYQRSFDFPRDKSLILLHCIDFVICEVKSGIYCINDTWLNQKRKIVHYTIRSMRFEEENSKIDEMAKCVYETGEWKDQEKRLSVRFICIGDRFNDGLFKKFPKVNQLLHTNTIEYLRKRFTNGYHQIQRKNWDTDIIWFAKNCAYLSNDQLIAWAQEGIGQ